VNRRRVGDFPGKTGKAEMIAGRVTPESLISVAWSHHSGTESVLASRWGLRRQLGSSL